MTIEDIKKAFISCMIVMSCLLLLLYPGVFVARHFLAAVYNNIYYRQYVLSFYANPAVFIKFAKYDYSRGRFDLFLDDIHLGLSLCAEKNQNKSCAELSRMLSSFNSGLNLD